MVLAGANAAIMQAASPGAFNAQALPFKFMYAFVHAPHHMIILYVAHLAATRECRPPAQLADACIYHAHLLFDGKHNSALTPP